MRLNRRHLLAAGLVAACAPALAGGAMRTTRFLDPEGRDDADGLSPRTAWRSLDALAALPRGAALLDLRLRRGGVWAGGLAPVCAELHLSAYGEGSRPVIDGGRALAEPRRVRTLSGGALWEARTVEPLQVMADGRHLVRAGDPAALDRPGLWRWSEGRLLAATAGDRSPSLVAVLAVRALDLRGLRAARLRGLEFRHAAYGIDMDDAARCALRDCVVRGAYVNGIRASAAGQPADVAIEGTTVLDTAGTAIAFGGRIARFRVSGCRIARAALIAEAAPGPLGLERSFAWTAGIKNWGWGEPGWQGEVCVRETVVEHCGPAAGAARPEHGHGIWIDEVVEPSTRHAVVFNSVRHCASRGIYVEKSDRVDVDYNEVVDCARTPGTGALALGANHYGYDVAADAPARVPRSARGNRMRHNTVVGGAFALEAGASDLGCRLEDNAIEDNILVGLSAGVVTGGRIALTGGAANDGANGSGNRYARNGVGPARGRSVRWGRLAGLSPTLAEVMSRGAFHDAVAGDPAFADPTADLRLRAESPCLDRGLPTERRRDRRGVPVPLGGGADIGAHEFRGAAPSTEQDS